MSRVCQTNSFGCFVACLLDRLPSFHAIYNDSVHNYRQSHRIRSQTHPVPDLAKDGDWLEIPFWVWREGDHKRQRPYGKQTGSEIQLRDNRDIFARIPVAGSGACEVAATIISGLGGSGIRFRTRALTTTLFARLCLADLFVHGIGGATYDSMTDQICQDFFGLAAPPFATISATVYLPLVETYPISARDLHEAHHRMRELRYNPDRIAIFSEPESLEMVTEKKRIIDGLQKRHPNRSEHQSLAKINSHLYSQLTGDAAALQSRCDQIRRQLRANAILHDREFSWCLHSGATVDFFRNQFVVS